MRQFLVCTLVELMVEAMAFSGGSLFIVAANVSHGEKKNATGSFDLNSFKGDLNAKRYVY